MLIGKVSGIDTLYIQSALSTGGFIMFSFEIPTQLTANYKWFKKSNSLTTSDIPFALVFASDSSHFFAYTSQNSKHELSLIRGVDGVERF